MIQAQHRDSAIDILRSIAMISIIVAHTVQNKAILQCRSFDVPLMVFLSGLCYKGTGKGYLSYVWKRFIRLIIPTWIFLGLYFSIIKLQGQPIDGRIIYEYFSLQTVWYVWIIRVFFSIALVSPLIVWCGDKCGKLGFWGLALAILIALSFLARVSDFDIYQYLLISIGYTVFFYFGYQARSLSVKELGLISLFAGGIFAGLAIYFYLTTHAFVSSSAYKYPPQLYYAAYAIFCIVLLFLIRKPLTEVLEKCKADRFFSFIGSHTLWMYFYHIILLTLTSQMVMNGGLYFLLIFSGALLLTWLHSLVFGRFNNTFVRSIFIG